MGDTTNLVIGLVFGSIGVGYCIYGKKQSNFVAFVAGLALIAMPYITDNNPLLVALSIAAMLAPKFIKL